VTGEFLMPPILREYIILFYEAKTSHEPQNYNPHNPLFSNYIQILDLPQTFKTKMEPILQYSNYIICYWIQVSFTVAWPNTNM
jgi:hypothetical protein